MKLHSQQRRWPARLAMLVAVVLVGSAVPQAASAAPAHPELSDSRHGSGRAEAPTGLRTDGQAKDVLVNSGRPVLAWTVNDSGRAEAQTGYQLRLTADPANHDVHPLSWDSGLVKSSNSTDVSYSGPALADNHSYSWSVRTRNRAGQTSAWSAPARFDTGLNAAADWSAWWLQTTDGALVRSDFTVSKPVARARLYFGAQGLVEPHLNGAPIDPSRILDSSITDYAKRVLYRELDVTKKLVQGPNALAFMVAKGQFSHSPVFVAQLNVTYTDGSTATFGTDPSWKTTAGPVTGADFYYGETYDARKQTAGWDTAGLDDSSWAAARSVAPAAHPQSLAQGKPVTALDTTSCCGWSPGALTDGVDGSDDSSEGYHSGIGTTADATKWVQTDLASDQAIRKITLFPARPTNDTDGDLPGAGFPVRYRVQVSDDPAFATATTVADHTDADQPNPGTTPVSLAVSATGRYVRVTATKLYCHGGGCNFRLAELGVYVAQPAVVFSSITTPAVDLTPPTRIVAKLAPVKETQPVAGHRVYDFGQNYTGSVRISAKADAGTTITLTKGEILDAAGRVSTSNISFNSGDPVRQTDHYTFSGDGTESYAPHFNYSGFRYAELTGLPDDATVTVTAEVEHTDVTTTGRFTSSNALLNKIQTAVLQTQANALQTIPVDCPTREKHGWLGDAGDSDQEAMSNYDMQSFYAKWLGDVATSANADGSLPSVAPTNGDTGWFTDPAWGSAYPQVIWDSYQQYGNSQLLATHYSQVKSWVDYLGTISDADHVVVRAPGSWGDDWVASVSTPHDFFQTGFAYLDASLLAKMATVLGKTADASEYTTLAGQIAAGFTKRYFTPATNVYGTGTQLSYAMPLVLGIVPAGHEQAVLGKLVQGLAANDNHVTTGFVGTEFVYEALGQYHRNDVALAIAEKTDFPSFGYMVNNGPGTIWEKWPNSTAPDGTSSKDHIGLGGSIGQWFYQQLAGIQPGAAAYRSFTLAPSVVGDLTDVSAQQQTVRGLIKSSWHRSGSTLTYHASVPVGSTATIELPLLGGRNSTVREGNRTILAGGRNGSAPGLTIGKATDQTLTLTAGSGDYTFTVEAPRTAFTQLTLTATGNPEPLRPGRAGTIGVLVEGRSTGTGSTTVSAQLPAGWTTTAQPVTLTPGSTATLVSLPITVPATATGGRYPVTLTARAPDGTAARTSVELIVFGTWPSGTTAAASSFHAPNTVNGEVRTYDPANAIDGKLPTFWNDDTDSTYPDTLTVTAGSATSLTGVGFASNPDGVPTDFAVQTLDGDQWVTHATETSNTALYQWIPFPKPVTTTQVRVVVTGAQNSWSRIAELTP
jgi:alpha-L-rhamnosidase